MTSLGGESSFSLVRYLSNGTLDLSFGSSGKVVSPFLSGPDHPTKIVQQPDGKYILAGEVSSSGSKYAAVARYNTDGSVDSSFGTNGLVITKFPFLGGDPRLDIEVQGDGKLILGHSIASSGNSGQDFLVVRLTQSGALDSTFSGIGYSVVPVNPYTGPSPPNDYFQSLTLQPDGKILVAGTSWMYSSPRYFQFAAARLNSNGSLDTTFSPGDTTRNAEGPGKLTADPGTYDDDMSSIVLQSSGKLILIGASETSSTGSRNPVFIRYDNNGYLDTTFGNSGVVKLTVGSSAWPTTAAVGADDSIFFAGRALSGVVWKPFVSKVNPTGSLDTNFGSSGVRYLDGAGRVTDIAVFGNEIFVSVEDGSSDFVWYRLSSSGADAPFPTPTPTYLLAASRGAVDEGSTATFTLSTTNVAAGTVIAYAISGVSSADVTGGALAGTVTVGTNGQATISIPIAADNLTEGTETLTVTAQGKSASVTINDTSLTGQPTFNPSTGHYYQFVPANIAYPNRVEFQTNQFNLADESAAKSSYRGLSGYLATITSGVEHDFVVNLVGATNAYLGGSDRASSGDWRWIAGPEKGTRINDGYTNWYPGEPSNNGFGSGSGLWQVGVENALGMLNTSGGPWSGRWVDTDEWYVDHPLGSTAEHGYVIEYGGLPPSYQIVASSPRINEGSSVTFDVYTKNVEWGTSLSYSISGISSGDLATGNLNGSVVVQQNGADGKASLTLLLANDERTEGEEALTFSING